MRFKEFEGELKSTVFAEVCKIGTGNKNTQDREKGGIHPFYVRSATIERINSFTFDGEAILTAGDGVGVGKVFHYTSGKIGVHQRVYILSEFKSVIGKFLFYYFSNKFNDRVSKLSAKNSVDSVRYDMIAKMPIAFPGISEQLKIAKLLSAIDTRIASQSKIIDKLKTSIKIIRKKVFNQDLRFKDDNGNSYPNWETKKLGHLGTFFSGGTPLTTKRHYFDGNIPFIRSGEINASSTEQYISKEGLKNSSAKMVEIGDLIYALYGATSGEVGISKIKGAINQAILCLRTDLKNVFLLNYLKFQKENILSTFLQGGQGNLSAEIIKSLKIPVPTIKEQAHIASVLSNMESKIELEINILNTYQKQKQYLLSNLFI